MKRIITLSIMLLISIVSFSNCKKLWRLPNTTTEIKLNTTSLIFKYSESEVLVDITVWIERARTSDFNGRYGKREYVTLKLENGESVKIMMSFDYPETIIQGSSSIGRFRYKNNKVSLAQLEKLSNSKVVSTFYSALTRELNVKEKKGLNGLESFVCVYDKCKENVAEAKEVVVETKVEEKKIDIYAKLDSLKAKRLNPVEVDVVEISEVTESCSSSVIKKTDKMTGTTSLSSLNSLTISNSSQRLSIYMMNMKNVVVLNINVFGAGSCIDDDNEIIVLFKDGTKLKMYADNKFNCKSEFTLYFKGGFGKISQLEELRSKEIETIRVYTSSSVAQVDLTKEQSIEFMETIKCISQ
jgi:hypothetical protein